jgi:hypothetical protein
VAQVVEADDAHAGITTPLREAPGDLAAVERLAGLRVGEDQVEGGVHVAGTSAWPRYLALKFLRDELLHVKQRGYDPTQKCGPHTTG